MINIMIITAVILIPVLNAWGTPPYTFTAGTTAKSSDVNTNFQYVDPAMMYKTGQTTSYATGDDGDLQKGTAWPQAARFNDNDNGTVTDNLTGLIWLKRANCFGAVSWTTALSVANSLASGSCGLADGSSAGNWRLPNVRELASLMSVALYGSVNFSDTHPFTGIPDNHYWSSTTLTVDTSSAFAVGVHYGYVGTNAKTYTFYVWPVR